MKFFFDCEFVEDGKTIDLISIGIVSEDNRFFYAVSAEFDLQKAKAHPFVSKYVMPHVEYCRDHWMTRKAMAQEVVAFVGEEPEFWADFAAYDWIALCQLYGPMVDLPKGWPMFCRDVQQLRKMLNHPKIDITGNRVHHALFDARETKARFDYLWQIHQDRLQALAKIDELNNFITDIDPASVGRDVVDVAIETIRKLDSTIKFMVTPRPPIE